MWEAYEWDNEDLLWSCIAFNGGIGEYQQAPCGAISASAVCLGLRYRCPLTEKERAKHARRDARDDASELVRSFTAKFGTIICRDLIGFDFFDTEAQRQALESGVWAQKCDSYIQFIIDKLYELEERRSTGKAAPKVVIYTASDCPICAAAKENLEERGIPYEEISIQDDPSAIEVVKRLSNGKGIVPVIVSGDDVKVGFGGG